MPQNKSFVKEKFLKAIKNFSQHLQPSAPRNPPGKLDAETSPIECDQRIGTHFPDSRNH